MERASEEIQMLRVLKVSGDEAFAIPAEEFNVKFNELERPVRAFKRHLQSVCGEPRFKQRLLLEDGTVLCDDSKIEAAQIQLVLLSYRASESATEEAELMTAAQDNDVEKLESLLQRPLHPDSCRVAPAALAARGIERTTPLAWACYQGHCDVAILLLEAGAVMQKTDNKGRAAISWACVGGSLEVVCMLLEAGADLEHSDDHGRTPLALACVEGHVEVVHRLLEAGADRDRADVFGTSPLAMACSQDRLEVVRLLLDAGAKKDTVDHEGETPLSCVCKQGRLQIVRLLLEAGAAMERVDYDGSVFLKVVAVSWGPQGKALVADIACRGVQAVDVGRLLFELHGHLGMSMVEELSRRGKMRFALGLRSENLAL
ncbi:ANKRD50, partial [Symbiodinium sp. CCMP2456]